MGEEENSAVSAEYDTLVHHTADLQLAVKTNLTSLGGNLVSINLLNSDQYAIIRNQHNASNDRAADLIEFLKVKVLQNPENFHNFICVLKGDQSEYHGILKKLEQTYQLERKKLLISISESKNAGQASYYSVSLLINPLCMHEGYHSHCVCLSVSVCLFPR